MLRALDGSDIVDASWIRSQHLPRSTMGKWIRLKMTGTLPSKVAIDQLVYWKQPYLLPILQCPVCQRVGHSINTCCSYVRCSRCSGPHSYHGPDATCDRPYFCFQYGGHHGTRSANCSSNREAKQLYCRLTQERMPLIEINKQLRLLSLPKSRPSPQPHPPTTPPSTATPSRTVHPCISYSAVTTENRYSVLQDPSEENDMTGPDLQDTLPTSPPSTPTPRPRHQ